MKTNSILIISNSNEAGKKISEKIKLLRECDTVRVVSYIESISVLNTTQPTIIILYCANNDTIGIIKEIRSISALNKVPIMYVTDEIEEERLLHAFDNGIDDFFSLNESDSVILMRIFLTLQKSVLYKKIEISNQILIAANILDKQTGIYKKEQAPLALRNFFNKSIEENLENTVFMFVKPMSKNKKRVNINKIGGIIKNIPRGNDIIAYGKNLGFYIILYDAGAKGAESIAKRIKKALINECDIYANAAEITASFEEMEPILTQYMKIQIEDNLEFQYIPDITAKNIQESVKIQDESGKSFKTFKQEFKKNFEKLVKPIFEDLKDKYKNTCIDSEISFEIKETYSIFEIKQDKNRCELKITYPSYISAIVDIVQENEDEKKEVKRLTYDFEDFSEEIIRTLTDSMFEEFANRINLYEN